MDTPLNIVCTGNHGNKCTACYILSSKQTACLRSGFKLAQFQTHPPFNILTLPSTLTV